MAVKKSKTNTAKKAEQKVRQVPIISARIDKLYNYEDSNLKAVASVNIGGAFAVHGIRIIESQKGMFVAMPSTRYTDSNGETKYRDITHPVTSAARKELIDKVTEAYDKALEEQQNETKSEDETEDETEDESESQELVPQM